MISGNLDKIYYENDEELYGNTLEADVDYSKIVIPFSKIFKSNKPKDIYSGTEKIPFRKRDLEYKLILRQEFKEI